MDHLFLETHHLTIGLYNVNNLNLESVYQQTMAYLAPPDLTAIVKELQHTWGIWGCRYCHEL